MVYEGFQAISDLGFLISEIENTILSYISFLRSEIPNPQ
jgi:hypothetical protein